MSVFTGSLKKLVSNQRFWGWVDGMYIAGDDCAIALRLKAGYEYEPASRKLWRSLCKNAEIAIDVGAHTGIYSLDGWKAGAKNVISIEPYHLNFARLVMNLRHSDFATHSAIFGAAGEENNIAQFNINTASHYCSTGGVIGIPRAEPGSFACYPVQMRTLDSLIKEEFHKDIRVVKIDTEKYGVRVLKGMTAILTHKPDLILECIENGMGEILKPLGYRFYRINENEESNFLYEVYDLIPDDPITHESPNRYATTKVL